MKIFGYIYIIIDHWNNHVYIGQKKGMPEDSKNYFGSGKIITYVIQKRQHLLEKRILGYCETFKELNKSEKTCIEFYQSNNKLYGYNITNGGQGITGLFGELNPMFGKNHQSYGIVKFAKKNAGKTFDEIYGKQKANLIRKKISAANKSKTRTSEAKENYRKANTGNKNPAYKQLSKKQIQKIINEYQKNKYVNIIAKNLKISLHLVKRILCENNLPIFILPQSEIIKGSGNGRFIIVSKQQEKIIIQLYKKGFTMTQIMSQINLSGTKIKQILNKNNIIIQHSRKNKVVE